MSTSESSPRPVPKEEPQPSALKNTARAWGGRLAAAGALAMPLAGQAAEIPEERVSPQKTEKIISQKENPDHIAKSLMEARQSMREKIDRLGIFTGGPEFIENVKQNANTVRAFLDNPSVIPKLPGVLGEIVELYASTLVDAKKYAPSLYVENVKFFQHALEIVEKKPLTQVKQELIALF